MLINDYRIFTFGGTITLSAISKNIVINVPVISQIFTKLKLEHLKGNFIN